MRLRNLSALCCALMMCSGAHADIFRANESGIRAGFGGGQLKVDLDDDQNTVGWNVILGYEYNEYLAVEAGRIGNNSAFYGAQPTASGVQLDSVGNRFWHASVLGSYPLDPNISVFGRVGMMRWSGDTQTFSNPPSPKTDTQGYEPFYGLGAALTIDNGSLRLEYNQTEILDVTVTYIAFSAVWKIAL
jgi:hypothetical protein